MQIQPERLRAIRTEARKLYDDISHSQVNHIITDHQRFLFFYSELDTLMVVLNLNESKSYKESFILLRTVLEKLLYFWLMLEGKKYEHSLPKFVKAESGKSVQSARDALIKELRKRIENKDETLKGIVDVKEKGEDIIVYHIIRGQNDEDKYQTIYDEALFEYKPDSHYLSDFKNIEDLAYPEGKRRQEILQNMINRTYFSSSSIFDNLKMNDLVSDLEYWMAMTHYNFLSHFVHNGKESLEIWQKYSKDLFLIQNIGGYDDEDCHKLILLYVAKFMLMFMQLVVKHYKEGNPKFKPQKYESLIEELKDISKELWFIGDEPTEFDKRRWEALKGTFSDKIKGKGVEMPKDIQYYRDPLRRLEEMRKSGW